MIKGSRIENSYITSTCRISLLLTPAQHFCTTKTGQMTSQFHLVITLLLLSQTGLLDDSVQD